MGKNKMSKQKKNKIRLACPECLKLNFYTNKNERVCRYCGYRGHKDDFVFEMVQKVKQKWQEKE